MSAFLSLLPLHRDRPSELFPNFFRNLRSVFLPGKQTGMEREGVTGQTRPTTYFEGVSDVGVSMTQRLSLVKDVRVSLVGVVEMSVVGEGVGCAVEIVVEMYPKPFA